MAEQTVYITASGRIPNDGVPPGTRYVRVTAPQSGNNGKTPKGTDTPRNLMFGTGDGEGNQLAPRVPPPPWDTPAPALTPAPTPRPALLPAPTPPPALLPGPVTSILWLHSGVRPCDAPDGHYPHPFETTRYSVDPSMSVRQLIKELDGPAGDQYGIAELRRVGDPANKIFMEAISITNGSPRADKTLMEVGWRPGMGDILIMVKF